MVIYRLGLPYYKEFDNFQFVDPIRNKQQQLGEPHDFTHKQQRV